MKKIVLAASAVLFSASVMGQSMHVTQGSVSEAYNVEQIGEIGFGGNAFTIGNRSYNLSKAYELTYNETGVKDNSVKVTYNGNTASVVIAGNIVDKVTATVNGAHVVLLQQPSVTEEITYTLSGQSDNGSLYMDGDFKATFKLDNLTLHNPDSAAINIQDGKRIAIDMKNNTINTLSDGIRGADDGSDGHKACLYVDGHTEFQGSGALVINGSVKHGITSDEYCLVKASVGFIIVTSAPGDGLHVGQYFQQLGGNVTITCQGDGVDVGMKKDPQALNNGQVMIEGGQLNITATGDAVKGIKCEDSIVISGGDISINLPGNAYFDTAESDITSCAGIKPAGTFTMTGGSVNVLATGSGGKALNSDGAVEISGGKFVGVTCGNVFKYGLDDTKPQGIKSDGNITISGGEVYVAASKDKGTPFKTDYSFLINGGTLMGIGAKSVTASAASTQASKKYAAQNIVGGTTVTYDEVSFDVPAEHSNSAAYVIVSKPGI